MKYWRDALEVAGALCVLGALAYIHPVLAVGVLGVFLLVAANAGGDRARTD